MSVINIAVYIHSLQYEERNNERPREKERGGGSECKKERDGDQMKGYVVYTSYIYTYYIGCCR